MKIKHLHIIISLAVIVSACGSSSNEIDLVTGIASEDPLNFVWGFGFEGEEATSPGPTITVHKGEAFTINFKNETLYDDGRIDSNRHNFMIVADKDVNASAMVALWGAEVGGTRIMMGISRLGRAHRSPSSRKKLGNSIMFASLRGILLTECGVA
jgi:hypothetical protein